MTGISPDTDTVAGPTLDAVVAAISTKTLAPSTASRAEKAELHFLEAKRLHNGGDYVDARAALNEAVALDPGKGSYHRLLAQWLSQNPGCWEAAQKHFEEAIQLDAGDVEAHLGLAALHEEASSSIYEKVLTLDPDNRIAREKLEPHTHG